MAQTQGKAHVHLSDQVAGVKPLVAVLEHVCHYFLRRRVPVGVAVKGIVPGNLPQQQARFTGGYLHAAPRSIPQDFIIFLVVANQGDLGEGSPDGLVLVEQIGEGHIALAAAVNFADSLDPKTGFKSIPDVGAQAVAQHFFQRVVLLFRTLGLLVQVAANLSHINETVGPVLLDLCPEVGSGELPAQKHRPPG